eukprot:941953-Rhodomonas_salina.1
MQRAGKRFDFGSTILKCLYHISEGVRRHTVSSVVTVRNEGLAVSITIQSFSPLLFQHFLQTLMAHPRAVPFP